MKTKVLFWTLSLILTASSSSVLLETTSDELFSNDQDVLTAYAIKFLQPYQKTIQRWFWDISGLTYSNPFDGLVETQADYITCDICVQALPIIRDLLGVGIGGEIIIPVLAVACQVLHLAPRDDICLPTIQSYATSVLYIIKNKPHMPDEDFCGIINPGCVPISEELKTWKININDEKPPAVPRQEIPDNAPLSTILQFTDIHLDLDYEPGMNASCGLPICCRASDGASSNDVDKAGVFGHIRCGLPLTALKSMFEHARNTHTDAKFIFLTGDYVHSGVWLYSAAENGRHIRNVTQLLKDAFNGTSAEIYPLVGNHEPDVVNMYPPEAAFAEFPLEWMYDSVAAPFQHMFPPLQYELFRKYGYYSIISRNDPNLRIVALNTNICYINNFWLPYDAIDTFGQLQWFADTMKLAEILGQKVFVVGHIHTGSGSCWPEWSRQFNRVIDRYEAIIKGQWYGHSHEQDYKITFEKESGRPISVSYVAGSALTDGMNSAYNVYYTDGERGNASSWEIVNHETWILSLNESNVRNEPVFTKILDAKKDFSMKSLVPEEVHGLINRMVCDDELFYKYQKVVVKGEDSPRFRPCRNNTACKANVLGDLFVSNSADHSHREQLEELIKTIDCSAKDENGSSTTKATADVLFALSLILLAYLYA